MEIENLTLPELRDLAETTVTVAAAYEAGLFRALADGPASAAEVAERTGLDRRATAIVLPVLVEAGLLESTGNGAYRPTDACREGLCRPDADGFIGGGLPLWLHNLRGWTELPGVLRSGEPLDHGGRERDEEGLRRFMAGMAAAPAERVARLVDLCLARAPAARRILDLGGGPGLMSRAFIARGLEATLLDTPATVEFVGREYGLDGVEGLTLVPADFTSDPLPPGPWDVVLLSNVVHIYGPEQNRALVEKAAETLVPGGVLAISDFMRGRSGRAARFALVMLMRTEGGNTYAEEDFRAWTEAAGLSDFQIHDLDPDRQLVTTIRT